MQRVSGGRVRGNWTIGGVSEVRMSWTAMSRPKATRKGDRSKWICDHCAEVYKTAERQPEHRRTAGRHHTQASTHWHTAGLGWVSKAVHYCSDECAEEYDAKEVLESFGGCADYGGCDGDGSVPSDHPSFVCRRCGGKGIIRG